MSPKQNINHFKNMTANLPFVVYDWIHQYHDVGTKRDFLWLQTRILNFNDCVLPKMEFPWIHLSYIYQLSPYDDC